MTNNRKLRQKSADLPRKSSGLADDMRQSMSHIGQGHRSGILKLPKHPLDVPADRSTFAGVAEDVAVSACDAFEGCAGLSVAGDEQDFAAVHPINAGPTISMGMFM